MTITSSVQEPISVLHGEVTRFFEDFVAAFQAFDGHTIARRYIAPYLSLNAEGVLRQFGTPEEIGAYFQEIVAQYHQQGCRSCRFKALEIAPMGSQSVLATVTWELLRGDGSVINAWRESYSLVRRDGGFLVFASVDHVVSRP